MYRHKIILDGLPCSQNQSVNEASQILMIHCNLKNLKNVLPQSFKRLLSLTDGTV